MNKLSLTKTAIELLQINEVFCSYVKNQRETKVSDFTLYTFEQLWESTSGGFSGIGGAAMTLQRTYVFVPNINNEDCLVFFGGRFAYSVPYSEMFMIDIKNENVEGVSGKEKYFIEKNDV